MALSTTKDAATIAARAPYAGSNVDESAEVDPRAGSVIFRLSDGTEREARITRRKSGRKIPERTP